eukprot:PhF_6_TR33647/c0_g1_i3/m.49202
MSNPPPESPSTATATEQAKILNQLKNRAQKLLDAVRQLPNYYAGDTQSLFTTTLESFHLLWKHVHAQRQVLEKHGHLRRSDIGEIASKIAQLQYVCYLRHGDVSYLFDSLKFYEFVRDHDYFREDTLERRVRLYARHILVALLLNRRGLVRVLISDMNREVQGFTGADKLWRQFAQDTNTFLTADRIALEYELDDGRPSSGRSEELKNVCGCSYRLRSVDAVPCTATIFATQTFVSIAHCVIAVYRSDVRVSELPLDTLRILQSLEWEDGMEEGYRENKSAFGHHRGAEVDGAPPIEALAPIPLKTLLYDPSLSSLIAAITTGQQTVQHNSLPKGISNATASSSQHASPQPPSSEGGASDLAPLERISTTPPDQTLSSISQPPFVLYISQDKACHAELDVITKVLFTPTLIVFDVPELNDVPIPVMDDVLYLFAVPNRPRGELTLFLTSPVLGIAQLTQQRQQQQQQGGGGGTTDVTAQRPCSILQDEDVMSTAMACWNRETLQTFGGNPFLRTWLYRYVVYCCSVPGGDVSWGRTLSHSSKSGTPTSLVLPHRVKEAVEAVKKVF